METLGCGCDLGFCVVLEVAGFVFVGWDVPDLTVQASAVVPVLLGKLVQLAQRQLEALPVLRRGRSSR
jgi:hypothetical protein